MRLALLSVALLIAPSTTLAQEFKFGDLSNEVLITTSHKDISECSSFRGSNTCRLTRSSFGGVLIRKSEVRLYRNRLAMLSLTIGWKDYDRALQQLIERYGQPGKRDYFNMGDDALGKQRFRRSTQWAFGKGLLSIITNDGDQDRAQIIFSTPDSYALDPEPIKKLDF